MWTRTCWIRCFKDRGRDDFSIGFRPAESAVFYDFALHDFAKSSLSKIMEGKILKTKALTSSDQLVLATLDETGNLLWPRP